jgi:hypothetical protein
MKQLRWLVCLIAIAFLGGSAMAQTPTGTIQGLVTDKTGAAIQGASITIIRTATNEARNTVSDSAGRYSVPFVEPGTYTVAVDAKGFRSAKQENILVQVTETRPVDFKLDVGTVSETVQVSADSQSLDSDSSSMGQTIQSSTILELPDNGRNPFDFALLVPGVNDGPGNTQGASTPHIGGSRNADNEEQIDGMTNILPENNVGNNEANYTPVEDSVQELNVQTSVLPAEYGRFSGGTISLITKSGTNQWHGSFFEFVQNGVMDAVPFGTPGVINTAAKPPQDQYQTGGTVGGPIIKNRAFFFFDYENSHADVGSTGTYSVPNPAWYGGDFTSLYGATTPMLFDPDTVAKNANGVYERQPFISNTGQYNVIPAARISPLATQALAYFPKPNIPGAGTYNNFLQTGSTPTDYWHFDSREDGDVTKKWHSFLRYSEQHQTGSVFNDYNNAASPGNNGGTYHTDAYSASFNNTVTFTPTLLGEFRYGFSRNTYNRVPVGGSFSPGTLGFDSGFVSQAGMEATIFPNFQFGGNGSFSELGPEGYEQYQEDPNAQSVNAGIVKIHNAHSFKFGGEFRALRENFYQWAYPSGEFSSSDAWTRQFPQSQDTTGFSIASFLMGDADSGEITEDARFITTSQYVGFYGQDDWKVTPKLTLNMGLRYDFEIPRTEHKNELSFWNPQAPSPLQAQSAAISAALATAGESCAACGNLLGAISIVGSPGAEFGRRQAPTQKLDLAPRFGLAYNATPKVVIRAGFGLVFNPSALQASGTTGGSGTDGFNNSTQFTSSLVADDAPPAATLYSPDANLPASARSPFPNGYNTPQGNTASCLVNAACVAGIDVGGAMGGGGDFFDSYRTPYSIQWNGNVQYAAPGNLKIEIGYLALKGVFLINGDPGKPYDQLSPTTIQANGCTPGASTASCQILTQVPNPFYSTIGTMTSPGPYYQAGLALGGPTIAMGQLLKQWPQYSSTYSYRKPGSASMFNGLTVRVDKSLSQGLTFTFSLTDGREFDNSASAVTYLGPNSGTYANQYDPGAEWSLGAQNISYQVAGSFLYLLPFGHGQPFLNSAGKGSNVLINGWQVSGIENWSTGTPLIPGGFDNGTTAEALWANYSPFSQRVEWSGLDPKLHKPSYKEWFNTEVYSKPISFQIGNAPRTNSDVNNPSYQDLDLQIAKNTQIHDNYRLQLRLEMFNAFNHPVLAGPNMGITSGQFGVISSYVNSQRRIQLAAKINF